MTGSASDVLRAAEQQLMAEVAAADSAGAHERAQVLDQLATVADYSARIASPAGGVGAHYRAEKAGHLLAVVVRLWGLAMADYAGSKPAAESVLTELARAAQLVGWASVQGELEPDHAAEVQAAARAVSGWAAEVIAGAGEGLG